MSSNEQYDKYFLTYTGITLPLQLVNPLDPSETQNRNTYFGANLDAEGRLERVHKVVYGEVELEHRYGYNANGALQWAEIRDDDDEVQRLEFNNAGQRI
ncbi:DUF6156 family protein [Marinobacterium lutimaris]|uniref:YD repeat-containing protein n=1 Tax=Marinobacterium lutimaris TaxID=568106 RepID=A0A1H5VAP1_9GAMM|nr:DUF6156 family protein [Marinobacterium lutimaris]SEF84274.1 hypothetical protein SAMN05444390_101673 [Marinobacterium lutimaris]